MHQPYHQHILSKKALIYLALTKDLKYLESSDKSEYDTLFPAVNTRAISNYIKYAGDMFDVIEESFKLKILLIFPKLWFYAFFGYLFPLKGQMQIILKLL